MAVTFVPETLTSGARTVSKRTLTPANVVDSRPETGSIWPGVAAGPIPVPAMLTISPGATPACSLLAAFPTEVTTTGGCAGGTGVTGVCGGNSPEIFATQPSP